MTKASKTLGVVALAGLGLYMYSKRRAPSTQYGNVSVPTNSTANQTAQLITAATPLLTSLANLFQSGASSPASSYTADNSAMLDYQAAYNDYLQTISPTIDLYANPDSGLWTV